MSATTDARGLIAGLRAAVEVLRAAEFAVSQAAAALDASEVPAVSGYRSGGRLIEDAARVDPATAKRWIAHGRQLGPGLSFTGEPMPPTRPATAKVAEAGVVGSEHVRVIVREMDAVERVPGLGPDVIADAEATLAEAATQLAPHGVEKVAKRLLAHLDPDGVAPLDPPQDADELHLSTSRRDGSVSISDGSTAPGTPSCCARRSTRCPHPPVPTTTAPSAGAAPTHSSNSPNRPSGAVGSPARTGRPTVPPRTSLRPTRRRSRRGHRRQGHRTRPRRGRSGAGRC